MSGQPTENAVREELDRVVSSPGFVQSGRMKSFLRFVVEEALSGRADRLKEYTIAIEAYGRESSFDPKTSPVVRVDAGRLRRRLREYYSTGGADAPLRIDLPKGSYVPVFEFTSPGPANESATSLPFPTGPSIAVLPFDNLSGDPTQEYFSDGLTEELITELARFRDLLVIARHSTAQYKGQGIDVRVVGRDLGVRFVMEGSVRRAVDRIRVTAQLLEADSGGHVWANSYDRPLTAENLLELQEEISREVAATIAQPYGVISRATQRDRQRTSGQELGTYDCVLQFYDCLAKPSLERQSEVQRQLEKALESEPDYAGGWAALSLIRIERYRFAIGDVDSAELLDPSLEAATRAVELDPISAIAHQALFSAHFFRGELNRFRAAGDQAVSANPNHADMLADLGLFLTAAGDQARGRELTLRAIRFCPFHPWWYRAAFWIEEYRNRDYEAAVREARRCSDGLLWNDVMLACSLGQLGQQHEARDAVQRLVAIHPSFGQVASREFEKWNFPPDDIDHFLDGLQRAGLSTEAT